MQYRRAVAVERAFGIACSTGGVAQGRGGSLVEFGPLELFALIGDQGIIDPENRQRCLGLAQQHNAAVLRELRRNALDEWNEGRVEKKQAIGRMANNVQDLIIEQPRVDCVADSTNARGPIIQLEMAKGIPGQGAYPVAGLDPKSQQRAGQPLRPALSLGIGIAVDRSFEGLRYDLGVTMIR